jgi:deoxyadenosine/deoxycytidine kinase
MKYCNCIVLIMGFAGSGKFTTAKELAKHPNFRLVDNHTWNNPIFNLIKQDGITPLPEAVWQKAGKICDTVFETMKELSPPDFSFVITQEMIEGDEYPTQFYKRVGKLANDRNAVFVPVRLECDESELTKRVGQAERRELFKTIDTNRASHLARHCSVFHSNHPNELTINNTHKTAVEVASMITYHIEYILKQTAG